MENYDVGLLRKKNYDVGCAYLMYLIMFRERAKHLYLVKCKIRFKTVNFPYQHQSKQAGSIARVFFSTNYRNNGPIRKERDMGRVRKKAIKCAMKLHGDQSNQSCLFSS